MLCCLGVFVWGMGWGGGGGSCFWGGGALRGGVMWWVDEVDWFLRFTGIGRGIWFFFC